ncbi:hypothetical protein SpCBS45565_g05578 [Spizellomyces sp. 'palustris']|nr:hypothetical protein SpCBS45565_g05578 [Spizellomyces sp. 'palustris']
MPPLGSHKRKRSYLPPEILDRIFTLLQRSSSNTFPNSDEDMLVSRKSLHACCLVCHAWYFSAAATLWNHPTFPNLDSFVKFVATCHRIGLDRRKKMRQRNDGIGETNVVHRGSDTVWIARWGIENLRSLHLNENAFLPVFCTHKHLALIADARPELHHLSLANCHALNDAALSQIVCSVAPSLRTLDLTNCWQVRDLGVQMVAQFCGPWKTLQKLVLRNLGLVSNLGLAAVGEHLAPFLRVLDVSNCRSISDSGMANFLGKTLAEEVEIGRVSGRRTRRLGRSRGKLVELRFCGCRRFTRIGFNAVLAKVLKNNPDLHTLEFSTPVPPKGSPNYTFHNFPIQCFKTLTSLHIHRAEYLDDERIRSLADSCGPLLKEFSLINGIYVSEVALKYLLTHCVRLTYLSLKKTHLVTDAVVEHLTKCSCMPHLSWLDLSGCKWVTDRAAEALAKFAEEKPSAADENNKPFKATIYSTTRRPRAASLTHLIVADCPQLTLRGLLTTIRGCYPPAGLLEEVHVTGTNNNMELDVMTDSGSGETISEATLFEMVPQRVGVNAVRQKEPRWVEIIKGRRLSFLAGCGECEVNM